MEKTFHGIFLLNFHHKFSNGFRSGAFPGHDIDFIQFFEEKQLFSFALWQDVLSSWKKWFNRYKKQFFIDRNNSICPIDQTLTSTTTPGQGEVGSDSNEEILSSSPKLPDIRIEWLEIFGIGLRKLSPRLYLLCRVEFIGRRLKFPIGRMPTRPIFLFCICHA